MDFSLSEEHGMLLDVVRGLLRKTRPKHDEYRRMIFEEQRFPEEIWDHMAEAGIIGALVPGEYGGTGLGLLGMTLALEEFAAHGMLNVFGVLNTMASMAILHGGSEEQKSEWLPRVADGSVKLAFAITETDAGTNSFAMQSLAKRDGDTYRLNGAKAWITGADVADYILVVARTVPWAEIEARGLPKAHGLGLFLVDVGAAGLEKQPMDTAGIEGYRQFMLYFSDVELPVERRIGAEHRGAEVLFHALNPERVLTAAAAIGLSEFALRKAIAYAGERKVFGDVPIGAYQGVQHPLVRARIAQEAARMLTYKAAWLFDGKAAPDEAGHWANMAKHMASEMAVGAVDAAIQTHGGSGFVREHQLISLWAPVRLFKTAPINNEMLLNQLAEHMLGLPRSY
jgi:alkylation response protein AidB-like acyl-CoA dehydrogenase